MFVSTNLRSETRSTRARTLARFGSVLSVFAMLAFFSGCTPPTPCTSDAGCTTDADPVCVDGFCEECGNAADCDDGDACTTDTCDEDDECVHAALDCNDGDACTDDSCDEATGCVNVPTEAAAACDATDLCAPESCDTDTGACVATDTCDPVTEDCDPADGSCTTLCTGATDCDACFGETCGADGFCAAGTAVDCDDADACTDDSCLDGVCSNDAIVCADGETCSGGICAPDTSCTSNADCDACLGETCDVGGTDNCAAGTPIDCDDSDACTDDSCADGVCSNTAVVCGAGETCVAGTCTATGAFDFTLGDDTLTGTTGDDVFSAAVGTVNPDDIAVGNGGTDVANLTIVGDASNDANGGPTLIDFDTVNFTTLNTATFDADNCAAIGTYAVDGSSLGGLILDNAEPGSGLAMGSGFAQSIDVDFKAPAADYMLTLNGSADGASYICTVNCGADVTVDVTADSFLGCGNPGTSCFGVATDVIVTGNGNLTITGVRPLDLNRDTTAAPAGSSYDMSGFNGTLTVVPEADAASNYDFSTGGVDDLTGVDQVTIVDTDTNDHTLTFDNADGDVTVDISGIDAADAAGGLIVIQGVNTDDRCKVILGGAGDGMGVLTASTTEHVEIVSGGTTANGILNVTTQVGTNFVTESVTVTGSQDCSLGTVTTESFVSTGLDAAAGVTLTAGTSPSQIDTGPGADDITGSIGADLINSGGGDDTVTAGVGADQVTLGSGADTVVMVVADVGDTITDFATGEDMFDWNTALSSTDASATTPIFASAGAAGPIAVGTTVHELTGVTVAAQTAAAVVTALGASATNADINANILLVIYTTDGGAGIWNWSNINADVQAIELTLVATLDDVVADSLVSADFP